MPADVRLPSTMGGHRGLTVGADVRHGPPLFHGLGLRREAVSDPGVEAAA